MAIVAAIVWQIMVKIIASRAAGHRAGWMALQAVSLNGNLVLERGIV
jgi:hypothetical protein